jgi:DNA-directed RNA polymerase specialized sigma24 family protein
MPVLFALYEGGRDTKDEGGFVDDDEIQRLVRAALSGDTEAWQRLMAIIKPELTKIVARPRFLGRLGRNEDDRDNIVVDVIARLEADGFRRLQLFLDAVKANPQLKFMSWLRVVAKRVGVDYMRAHPEYLRRYEADASTPGEWVKQGTLPPASELRGNRPPVTMLGTAHKLLEYARGTVTEEQYRALEAWTKGESFDEIAKTQNLTARDVERSVRAVLERLRRKFRDIDDENSV